MNKRDAWFYGARVSEMRDCATSFLRDIFCCVGQVITIDWKTIFPKCLHSFCIRNKCLSFEPSKRLKNHLLEPTRFQNLFLILHSSILALWTQPFWKCPKIHLTLLWFLDSQSINVLLLWKRECNYRLYSPWNTVYCQTKLIFILLVLSTICPSQDLKFLNLFAVWALCFVIASYMAY